MATSATVTLHHDQDGPHCYGQARESSFSSNPNPNCESKTGQKQELETNDGSNKYAKPILDKTYGKSTHKRQYSKRRDPLLKTGDVGYEYRSDSHGDSAVNMSSQGNAVIGSSKSERGYIYYLEEHGGHKGYQDLNHDKQKHVTSQRADGSVGDYETNKKDFTSSGSPASLSSSLPTGYLYGFSNEPSKFHHKANQVKGLQAQINQPIMSPNQSQMSACFHRQTGNDIGSGISDGISKSGNADNGGIVEENGLGIVQSSTEDLHSSWGHLRHSASIQGEFKKTESSKKRKSGKVSISDLLD